MTCMHSSCACMTSPESITLAGNVYQQLLVLLSNSRPHPASLCSHLRIMYTPRIAKHSPTSVMMCSAAFPPRSPPPLPKPENKSPVARRVEQDRSLLMTSRKRSTIVADHPLASSDLQINACYSPITGSTRLLTLSSVKLSKG